MKARLWLRVTLGKIANLAGIPGLIRDCRYSAGSAKAEITVSVGEMYTVISVNGLDIYFHRLSGAIDGVGGISIEEIPLLIQGLADVAASRTRSLEDIERDLELDALRAHLRAVVEAAKQVIEHELDYRKLNHLGNNPPQPYRQLAVAIAAAEKVLEK